MEKKEEKEKEEKKFGMEIFEMLKECPQGMPLYSTCFGPMELMKVVENPDFVIASNGPLSYFFDYDGKVASDGECVLRPSKNQRDWRKFRIPFKDGDFVVFTLRPLSDQEKMVSITAIFKGWDEDGSLLHHGYVRENGSVYVPDDSKGRPDSIAYDITCDRIRRATKTEMAEALVCFEDNEYVWNAHYKTIVPLGDEADEANKTEKPDEA